jgi:hypothetical protein
LGPLRAQRELEAQRKRPDSVMPILKNHGRQAAVMRETE